MNLATYIFIACAFVAFFVGLIALFIISIVLPRIRPIVELKMKDNIKKTYYNGLIKGNIVIYLKSCIAFSVALQAIDYSVPNKKLIP